MGFETLERVFAFLDISCGEDDVQCLRLGTSVEEFVDEATA